MGASQERERGKKNFFLRVRVHCKEKNLFQDNKVVGPQKSRTKIEARPEMLLLSLPDIVTSF